MNGDGVDEAVRGLVIDISGRSLLQRKESMEPIDRKTPIETRTHGLLGQLKRIFGNMKRIFRKKSRTSTKKG